MASLTVYDRTGKSVGSYDIEPADLSPRISKQDNFPFSDTDPLVKKLVAHAPTRILWGSDWPHPQYFKPMPNDVALLDMMLDWVPDEKTRKLIFVDNPAEIFGFPKI